MIANRLKTILPSVISETQSTFVLGRLITDNILMAFETLHHMKNHRKGKTGSMALKLDMSKVYNQVKWVFLTGIMEKMGFHQHFIRLVHHCISSVAY